MGYKAIQAKEIEYSNTQMVVENFTMAISSITNGIQQIKEGYEKLARERDRVAKALTVLNTKGDPVLEGVRKAYLEALKDGSKPCPPALDLLAKHKAKVKGELDKMLEVWIAKHESNFPGEVKVGMLFKCYYRNASIVEVIKGPTKSDNPNLKGDEHLFFDLKGVQGSFKGTLGNIPLKELKQGNMFKFVKL